MTSVSLDLFKMPMVTEGQEMYNTLVVCVDRHSGWIIALPCLEKGLTGPKIAKMMMREWRKFGVPSIVTTDQGSHFVSEWWKSMCAELGIRQAYAQGYHHQSNGRAEMAGQQLQEILRKVMIEEELTWVEALPRVLDRIHDLKGQAGLSPYEILFGRPRPLANLPYDPPKECEDANQFFARMQEIDVRVAKVLNKLHKETMEKRSEGRGKPKPFAPGDKCWYRRPENSGNKLDSRWLGPVEIVTREGKHSYTILVKPGLEIKAHRIFLKPYMEDTYNRDPIPLFYHRRTVVDENAEPDDFEVEEILDHKIGKNGEERYLTHWRGYSKHDATWEPPSSFLHRYSADFVRYCLRKGLHKGLLKGLHGKPHDD